jgi:hypothetical protein
MPWRYCFIPAMLFASLAAAQNAADVASQWRAFWVWGASDIHMNGGLGFFRLTFDVQGQVDSVIVQGSGDDGYGLYVNGKLVRQSGFGFNRSDKTDITPQIRQGRNVIAARVDNAAFPGGWLAQLQVNYTPEPGATESREQIVVSDHNTRFWPEEQPGWADVNFDDGKWEFCREIARPPGGVWGPLPLEYAGIRRPLKLVSLTVPKQAAAGDKLALRAVVRPMQAGVRDEEAFAQLIRDGATVGSATVKLTPPSSKWTVGADVAVGPLEIPTNRFASSGNYELRFGVSRCAFEGAGEVATRTVAITGREGRVQSTPAKVADYQGAPALFIAGKPMLPMMYLQGRKPVPAEYAQMARAGYRVFSLPLPLGWVGEGKYDYRDTDEMMLAALEGAPEGYYIPRVEVTAPAWWIDAHPAEAVECADGTHYVDDGFGGTRHQSFASRLWRQQAGEALKQLIKHIQGSPYADRVIGYHIASGIYGEWHQWSPTHLPDVSEPMRLEFRDWCSRAYAGDLNRLNAAWGTKLASFDGITCASQEERYASDLGAFKDLSKSRRVPDYWRCLHENTVAAINSFAKVVKETTAGKAVAGSFYAYLTDIGWEQEGGHLAAEKAYQSPYIDFFCSPHSYTHRAMGEDGAFRAYPASIQLHGKLFIDEGDDRTHLSGDEPYMHAKNLDQDVAIMRREALNAFTNRTGFWWFDMTTAWFNDPRLLKTAADLHAIGMRTLNHPRQSWAEIAVVFDPTSFYALADWKTQKEPLGLELCNEQFRELQKIGAPYDVLLLDDLLDPRCRSYRCYVFLNAWNMPDATRKALAARLQKDGKALVFAYAPGFSSDTGLDAAHIADLAGIGVTLQRDGGDLQAKWTQDVTGIPGLNAGDKWGLDAKMAPKFAVTDPKAQPLAEWADGSGTAAAILRHDGWTGIYCGTGRIPAGLLAHALRLSGGHIWTPAWEAGTNFWAGNGLIGVHTSAATQQSFHLPWRATVKDATTGETLLRDGTDFTVKLGKWETAIYEVERK